MSASIKWQVNDRILVIPNLIRHFKSLYGFGGRCVNFTDVSLDFESCFKVRKNIKLGQKPGGGGYPKGYGLFSRFGHR